MRAFSWSEMWSPAIAPGEIAFRAAVTYLVVIIMLRAAGRKELARYAPNDVALLFLITVAARQTIVAEDRSLTSAFVGLGTLIGLDRLLSSLSFRSSFIRHVIGGKRVQLVEHGAVRPEALRKTRVSEEELRAHLRSMGVDDLGHVAAAYLERSGRMTFVLRGPEPLH